MQEVENIYGASVPAAGRSTTTEMMVSRQAQEVQAAMVVAKKFPRNEVESYNRIIRACQRKSLAEQAMYEYPRGGTKVTGPSIRLAEAMAQNWGNLDYGLIELEQKAGESQVMAYAWDLETNTRQTIVFSVPHIRATKKGNVPLTDPRDIYEMVANQGARRMRSCILRVIPGDVVESAVAQCNKTLMDGGGAPLIDLVRDAAKTFQEEYGIPLEAIEKYIGCKHEAFRMNDLIRLKKVFRSLKDGMAKREDYFDLGLESKDEEVSDPFQKAEADKNEKKKERGGSEKKESEPELDPSFVPGEQQTVFR